MFPNPCALKPDTNSPTVCTSLSGPHMQIFYYDPKKAMLYMYDFYNLIFSRAKLKQISQWCSYMDYNVLMSL